MMNEEKIKLLDAAAVPVDEWLAENGEPADAVDGGPVVQGDFRPEIRMPGGGQDPAEFARDMGRLAAKHGYYMRAGRAWFYDQQGRCLQEASAQAFRFDMLQHARVMQFSSRSQTWSSVVMGADIAAGVLATRLFLDQLPEIARVSQVPMPVWRVAGKGELPRLELLPSGYDAATKTLVIHDLKLLEMPVAEAMTGLMSRWLGEFPFQKDDAPRCLATVVAGMLSPFCELLVPAFAQRPAFIFTANREGGGKTLLARLCLCPVHGQVKITPPPEKASDAELKKLLGSVARAGESYLLFDNWKGDIESASLEAFITSNIWSDRTLGASEMFTAEKSCLVFVTGNAAKVSPDMRRRSLFVELFVEEVRTETRVIKRRIDEEDILADREELLSYLWSIVRHWDGLGRPRASIDHGTFGRWGHVVGAMAECVTAVCPLQAPAYEGDSDLAAFERLLEHCMEGEGDEMRLRPSELLDAARACGGFDRVGEEVPSDPAEKRAEAGWFGKLCGRFVGSRFERFKFSMTDGARQNRRYIISRA